VSTTQRLTSACHQETDSIAAGVQHGDESAILDIPQQILDGEASDYRIASTGDGTAYEVSR
jgi:hypothetical protein